MRTPKDLGYVGEGINKRLIYLAASSRILDDPISVIVISQSAAGKSYLIDTVKKTHSSRRCSINDQPLRSST